MIYDILPFLKDADNVLVSSMLDDSIRYSINSGTTLMEHGELCNNVIIVLKGRIRVYRISQEGKEITLYRIGGGETCILSMGCVMDHDPLDAVAYVEEPTDLLAIPANLFNEILDKCPHFRKYLFKMLLKALSDVMMLTEEITFHGVNKRIASYLINKSSETRSMILYVTHETIARELGTAREVVSRMIKEFSSHGILEVSRGKIKILESSSLEEIMQM